MNELELWLIRKNYLNNKMFALDYFRDNNLQDKLTLKEAASVVNLRMYETLYLLSGFNNLYETERYISENPEVSNMKISDIIEIG